MKVVLLAGGAGTRISEETEFKPKPMIEIGGMPIIWHIMKSYSYYGFNEFVICAGYKQHMIKEWFRNYFLYTADITFDLTQEYKMEIHDKHTEPWKVTVVDTGRKTLTGGRIKRIQKYIEEDTFMMTYGDGVCDVNIKDLLQYHNSHGKIATLTSVTLEQEKGILDITKAGAVRSFRKKKDRDGFPINAGYMILNRKVFDYIEDDTIAFEREPMEQLVKEEQLMSFHHKGFWQCMDTKYQKDMLEEMIANNQAPWMVWRY